MSAGLILSELNALADMVWFRYSCEEQEFGLGSLQVFSSFKYPMILFQDNVSPELKEVLASINNERSKAEVFSNSMSSVKLCLSMVTLSHGNTLMP